MKSSWTILTQAYHQREMVLIFLESFEKFRRKDIGLNYIIVENSDDISYKEDCFKVTKNLTWLNNHTNSRGSDANGEGVEIGIKRVLDDFVFLCHCDICITSHLFFECLSKKIDDGFKLIGTSYDPIRVHACTISGCMVETDIAKKVKYNQVLVGDQQIMDSGDAVTVYCRKNSIPHCYLRNSFNDNSLIPLLKEPFKSFQVDRCVDDNNNIIFMHLGRGALKTQNAYAKPGKTYAKEWALFCRHNILTKQK